MFCAIFIKLSCWRGGMADASDSKSDVGDNMWVQVPPPAPKINRYIDTMRISITVYFLSFDGFRRIFLYFVRWIAEFQQWFNYEK